MKKKQMRAPVAFLLLAALLGAMILCSCAEDIGGALDTVFTNDNETEEETMFPSTPASLQNGAIYRISSLDEKYENASLTAENFAMTDNSLVKVKTYTRDLSQMWRVILNENGTVSLENMSTRMKLSIVSPDNYKKEKTLSVCLDSTNDEAKEWQIYSLGEGSDVCVIQNVYTSLYAEVSETRTDGLWYARQEKYDGADSQKWKFTKLSDGEGEYPRLLVLSGDYQGSSSCPEIIYSNGVYYNYNQTGTVAVKTSTDLIHWTLADEHALRPRPEWLAPISETGYIWAPGVYAMNGRYFLYYCTSALGKQNSAIGVAVCDDLSTNTWEDLGMVMRSYPGDAYNAIDPNIFIDTDGTAYMLWGSYWTGIYMRRIDKETGKFIEGDDQVWHLAQGSNDMEASYLVYRDGYYYLFCARGGLSRGTYYWAVGRSTNLFGDYVDKSGKPLLEGGGTRLTEWKEGVCGVGHAQYFLDKDGNPYMVAESWPYRNEQGNGTIALTLSTIVWTEDGWPVTALDPNVLNALGE